MGLSLSIIIALFLVMPGALFFFGLTRLHSPDAHATPLDQYFSVALTVALIAAFVLHSVWLVLSCALSASFHWALPDPVQAFGLLNGDPKSPLWDQAIDSLREHPVRIALYFLTLYGVSWPVGKWANGKLQQRRGANWYELLTPAGVDFIVLTADIHLDEHCHLFSGWVKDFTLDRTGALQRVVLGYCRRRALPAPGEVEAEQDERAWFEIPGEAIVLNMLKSNTVNLDYFYPDHPKDAETIDISEPWELAWWAESLGVTEDEVRKLVRDHGKSAAGVRKHLAVSNTGSVGVPTSAQVSDSSGKSG